MTDLRRYPHRIDGESLEAMVMRLRAGCFLNAARDAVYCFLSGDGGRCSPSLVDAIAAGIVTRDELVAEFAASLDRRLAEGCL